MEYRIFFDNRLFIISDNQEHCFGSVNGMGVKAKLSEMKSLVDYFEQSTQVNELWFYHENADEALREFARLNECIFAAGGLVQNQNNDYLLIYRNKYWDLPKGKLEKGESFDVAALREVREECGLSDKSDLQVVKQLASTFHTYYLNKKRVLKQTVWYEMQYSGNDILVPQIEEQIEKVEWVSKSRLNEHFSLMYVSILDVFRAAELFT